MLVLGLGCPVIAFTPTCHTTDTGDDTADEQPGSSCRCAGHAQQVHLLAGCWPCHDRRPFRTMQMLRYKGADVNTHAVQTWCVYDAGRCHASEGGLGALAAVGYTGQRTRAGTRGKKAASNTERREWRRVRGRAKRARPLWKETGEKEGEVWHVREPRVCTNPTFPFRRRDFSPSSVGGAVAAARKGEGEGERAGGRKQERWTGESWWSIFHHAFFFKK